MAQSNYDNFQIGDNFEIDDVNKLRQNLFTIKQLIDNNSDLADDYKETVCHILSCHPDLRYEFQYLWNRCGC
ncbi:hypothetical protein HCG51_28345 [Tolypothrix sp. PCC 7910]|uniref:hypothetical protein n=1 Tax=Tolypothrix sp. PCC 7910 TaxID=2099387 RepID=UPI00142778DC|nr:hypothetical protein [Tolypothrix sp. PCC 7910]QIR40234.1 hypothetical protein HCG51_28345 [Tolypothrix sp. PCC 7910]